MAALNYALLGYQTASQFSSQRQQANAAIQQGNYQGAAYDQNAQLAQQQATDAVQRGAEQEGALRAQTRQQIGAARAAGGASGISGTSPSVLSTEGDIGRVGELDALNARANALREAWGFTTAANQYTQQGQLARLAGRNTAGALRAGAWGTLLTGAAQGYNQYRFNQMNQSPSVRPSTPTVPLGGYNVFRK